MTATKHIPHSPANWSEDELTVLLDAAYVALEESVSDQNMKGRVIRKKRSVGLVPTSGTSGISREALDESVLRCQAKLSTLNAGAGSNLPFCAFNGGSDVWVDIGNKRVAVEVLSSFLGINPHEILHIGDQFLNTGNDYAARAVCPCIWITSPDETTYILKTILRLAEVEYQLDDELEASAILAGNKPVDFEEMDRRTKVVQQMDVYTGEIKKG